MIRLLENNMVIFAKNMVIFGKKDHSKDVGFFSVHPSGRHMMLVWPDWRSYHCFITAMELF